MEVLMPELAISARLGRQNRTKWSGEASLFGQSVSCVLYSAGRCVNSSNVTL